MKQALSSGTITGSFGPAELFYKELHGITVNCDSPNCKTGTLPPHPTHMKWVPQKHLQACKWQNHFWEAQADEGLLVRIRVAVFPPLKVLSDDRQGWEFLHHVLKYLIRHFLEIVWTCTEQRTTNTYSGLYILPSYYTSLSTPPQCEMSAKRSSQVRAINTTSHTLQHFLCSGNISE